MEVFRDAVSVLFIAAGCFFALTGAVGILRMPDFYTRIHPAGKTDSLAQLLILFGLLLRVGDLETGVKLVLISLAILYTAPTAAHAIIQAAHLGGLKPWQRPEDGKEESA